jgi:hypothetical protein
MDALAELPAELREEFLAELKHQEEFKKPKLMKEAEEAPIVDEQRIEDAISDQDSDESIFAKRYAFWRHEMPGLLEDVGDLSIGEMADGLFEAVEKWVLSCNVEDAVMMLRDLRKFILQSDRAEWKEVWKMVEKKSQRLMRTKFNCMVKWSVP